MDRDKLVGGSLLALSIIVIIFYGYLVFWTSYSYLVLQLTAFIAILGVFAILGWIGYTLATTPQPKPIEEIEKEIEKELEELQGETKQASESSKGGREENREAPGGGNQ